MWKHWTFYKHLQGIIGLNILSTLLFSGLELLLAILITLFLQISGLVETAHDGIAAWIPFSLNIQTFCLLMLGVAVMRLFVEYCMHYSTNIIGHKALYLLRQKLFDRFLASPPLVPSQVNHLNGTIFNNTKQYFSVWILFTSFSILIALLLLYMFLISWMQALICIGLTLIVGLMALFFSKKAKDFAQHLPHENNAITRFIHKIGANLFYIHLSKMQDTENQKLQTKASSIMDIAKKTTSIASFSASMSPFLGMMMIVAIFFTTQFTFKDDMINSVAFLYLFMRYIQFLTSTTHYYAQLHHLAPDHKEAMMFYKTTQSPTKHHTNATALQHNGPVSVRFENVHFSYDETPMLEAVSFDVKAGSWVGFRGESGVGKSTLFALTLGFEAPIQGRILIEGQDNKTFIKEHQPVIGYVGPEPFLFEGSLRENLTYGIFEPRTDQEIMSALDAVAMTNHVSSLDEVLKEDLSNMSSGQKQRLCIARMILAKPSLILLDEFSSNLDEATEKSVLDHLKQTCGNITTMIISHKPYALTLADQVYTLSPDPNRRAVKFKSASSALASP